MKWIDWREERGEEGNRTISRMQGILQSSRFSKIDYTILVEERPSNILWTIMDPESNKWRNTF